MIINVDFDGTCTTHDFPEIGKDIGAVRVLKRLVNEDHKLILFTMRSDKAGKNYLTDAVNWFKDNDIPLYGIQTNPTQKSWTSSPKSFANLMIDDSALFAPLKFDEKLSNKPFIDWDLVEIELERLKLI